MELVNTPTETQPYHNNIPLQNLVTITFIQPYTVTDLTFY